MKTNKAWHGVRLRWVEAAPDPDAAALQVQLPAAWEPAAAMAVAQLAEPGTRRVSLPEEAGRWIGLAAARADAAGLGAAEEVCARLHDLLLRRRGAPGLASWRPGLAPQETPPRFVLNLPAFHDAESGFDHAAFAVAAEWGALSLALIHPGARRLAVGFADLDGLLARMGLAYEGAAARDVAAAIATLLRGRAECASARLADAAGPQLLPDMWQCPALASCPAPLAAAAAEAFHAAAHLGGCAHAQVVALTPADMAELLLGVETTGYAPAFARIDGAGRLTGAARGLLAARGLSAEAALAATLGGDAPLALPGAEAAAAMRAALLPLLPLPAVPRDRSQGKMDETQGHAGPLPAHAVDLPRRRSGMMQRVTIGGHRLYLQTAEYPGGQLGQIDITLQRETPAYRALMDAFASAVSIGLQHGVPLRAFVEAFAGSRFGAAGPVEGDGQIALATSALDYVFRHLAETYLGEILPEPDEADFAHGASASEAAPTLPLDWPEDTPETRRRRFRLVG
ncbi:TSCPD domain-containing protein [Acidisoma sp. C75]